MKKKSIIIFLLIVIISILSINLITIKADSGWDSSYDSDWDSGSSWDWDSGSSWDWDSGSSRSSSGSSFDPVAFIIFIVVIIIIFSSLKSTNNKNNNINKYNQVIPSSEGVVNLIKKQIPNFDEQQFLNDTYQVYLDVQKAWMNFDYDKLKGLLTDELYNTYHSQLKALNAKKQKNIMDGFHLNNHRIASFNNSNKELTIKTYLSVAFYDYVVDKNENVVRGNKYRKIVMTYELTFIRSVTQGENKCPNCRAPLSDSASNYCEYCRSTIVSSNHKWVLSKKQAINQNWER